MTVKNQKYETNQISVPNTIPNRFIFKWPQKALESKKNENRDFYLARKRLNLSN